MTKPQTTNDYEEGHGIPQSVIDQADPSVPEECHLLTNPRTDTATLISAMEILSRDIQSEDGVANAAIAEAAERLRELTAENARLTAKGAAGDVLREAAQRVINSVSPCTHAERAAVSSLYKQITAYDTAKENLND